MKPNLNQLIAFFRDYEYREDVVVLDQCTKVLNSRKFVKSHLNALISNKGNKTFTPYYDRLVAFYNVVRG